MDFVHGRNLPPLLPLLHPPSFFSAYKQAPFLAALICRDEHVFSPSPHPPHCLCSPSVPAMPSSPEQGGESGQAGPTLGPALVLARCWSSSAPSKGRASQRCPAGCRICPSRGATVRKHRCACCGIGPCSMLKSGHGKDIEKQKPVHGHLAVVVLPLRGAAKLQHPMSRSTANQAGPALQHSLKSGRREGDNPLPLVSPNRDFRRLCCAKT